MTPLRSVSPPCTGFRLGLETLLADHPEWLTGQRIGLVSHDAAVGRDGIGSAETLRQTLHINLAALFGPEHGFAGHAGAGELTQDFVHPDWGIPVFSLYGETRKPTPAMLDLVDVLIVELQDLGARPYTYVSTLRLVLEAASEARKTVIVADRPVPLPRSADGPLMDPVFASFVGLVPTPMQYGMTQAETALWLARELALPLDLRPAPMRGYARETDPQPSWPPWQPPSPRIRSWASANLFACTVCGEALPALDYGSGTEWSFQVMGAPWLNAARLIDDLTEAALPGVVFEPIRYLALRGLHAGTTLDGFRIVVSDAACFRPITVSVAILDRIQRLHGPARLWEAPGTRPEWFDKLFGTDRVRRELLAGQTGREIAAAWADDCAAFTQARASSLLYPTEVAL